MRLSDLGKTPEDELMAPVEACQSPPAEPVKHPPAENVEPELVVETPAETPPPGFLSVLKNKNFVTLWSGQIFSQLADKVLLVLMIAIIESQFQSQNQSISGWVSAITIANTIPAVLFGSLAGVFVDRWHKKEVLVITNLLRGALLLLVPFLLWLTKGQVVANLPLGFEVLLLVSFAVSTFGQFFDDCRQAKFTRSQFLICNYSDGFADSRICDRRTNFSTSR
jgi:hypothetical protein